MVAELPHVPGESGNEVDLIRVGLEADEQLGLLRRAYAGEVPQPLAGPLLLALDLGDVVVFAHVVTDREANQLRSTGANRA